MRYFGRVLQAAGTMPIRVITTRQAGGHLGASLLSGLSRTFTLYAQIVFFCSMSPHFARSSIETAHTVSNVHRDFCVKLVRALLPRTTGLSAAELFVFFTSTPASSLVCIVHFVFAGISSTSGTAVFGVPQRQGWGAPRPPLCSSKTSESRFWPA